MVERLENLGGIQKSISILEQLYSTVGTEMGPESLNIMDKSLTDAERQERSIKVARIATRIAYTCLPRLKGRFLVSALYVGLGMAEKRMMRGILAQPNVSSTDNSLNLQ